MCCGFCFFFSPFVFARALCSPLTEAAIRSGVLAYPLTRASCPRACSVEHHRRYCVSSRAFAASRRRRAQAVAAAAAICSRRGPHAALEEMRGTCRANAQFLLAHARSLAPPPPLAAFASRIAPVSTRRPGALCLDERGSVGVSRGLEKSRRLPAEGGTLRRAGRHFYVERASRTSRARACVRESRCARAAAPRHRAARRPRSSGARGLASHGRSFRAAAWFERAWRIGG